MSLIVVYGPVAAGKLTVATEIASQTGFTLFHNHMILDALTEIFPFSNEALTEPRKRLHMQFKELLYKEILSTKRNVVTTSTFGGERTRNFFQKLLEDARQYDEPVYFVRLTPSRESLFDRVVQSSRSNKVNSIEKLEEILAKEGYGFEEFKGVEHLCVDNTDMPAADVAREVVEHYKINEHGNA